MTRYKHITSGAVVSVRDDKVLDSQWKPFDGSTGDEAPKGYGDMKAAELKAEIEKRNADREDDAQLSTKGNKAALVAVLEADDAESDEESDEDDSDDSDDDADSDD